MANQADFSIHTMCRVLGLSPSGFDEVGDRPPLKRSIDDSVTTERIRHFYARSDATYDIPHIRADLVEERYWISRKRVARLMRRARLHGVSPRRNATATTQRDARQRPALNLVKRAFVTGRPNQLWVADMICVPIWAGASIWPW